ncbi:hypothetical protein O9929_04885 [Vibrio lentus]|nr:hypothetical protein [Vibrio lentus]
MKLRETRASHQPFQKKPLTGKTFITEAEQRSYGGHGGRWCRCIHSLAGTKRELKVVVCGHPPDLSLNHCRTIVDPDIDGADRHFYLAVTMMTLVWYGSTCRPQAV